MTPRHPGLLAVLPCVLAGACGCAAPPGPPPVVECSWPHVATAAGDALVARDYGAITPIPLDAVQFTDAALARRVVVQMLGTRRTATNTVQVTGRLVNCTDAPLVVGSRLHFMDARQVPVEEVSAWQRTVLRPRALGQFQVSSTATNVEHYVVELSLGNAPQ